MFTFLFFTLFPRYNSAYLRHLAAQLLHLSDLRLIPAYFISAAKEMVILSQHLDEVLRQGKQHSTSDVALLPEMEHIDLDAPLPTDNFSLPMTLSLLGRNIYLRPTPAVDVGALAVRGHSEALDALNSFQSDGFALVDGFLSERALRELRAFCEQSTIFHKNYIQVCTLMFFFSLLL